MSDIWSRLGIAPTTDPAELRRAYAERLKQVRPDRDPAGFLALREAFERARDLASGTARPPRAEPAVRPQALVDLSRQDSMKPAVEVTVRACLNKGDLLGAARAWEHGAATGDLGFDEEPRLQEEIARAAASEPKADLAILDEAAHLLRWEDASKGLHAPQAILDVMARRAAFDWLENLRTAARAGWRWSRKARRLNRAARLLLRPAPGPIARMFPYSVGTLPFDAWLSSLATHRRWLGHAVDPARAHWSTAWRRRPDVRFVTIIYRGVAYFIVPVFVVIPLLNLLIAVFRLP